jgi:hypothetical protein
VYKGLVRCKRVDKFLQRDLAAERKRIRTEGAALGERAASHEKRFEALKSNHSAAERRAAAFERVAATVGALVALGTHHSTPATFYLTAWGLVTTTLTLMSYFVAHSEGAHTTSP